MKKLIIILLIVTFAIVTGCNNQSSDTAASAIRQKIEVGASAPDFALRDLQEKNVSIAEYKGKVLLLTFWKVKCKDCIKTLPSIEALSKKLNNPDLALLTINVDNLEYVKPEKIHAFLRENRFTFRVAVDETFSASEAYNLLAVPMTYVINKKGTISDIKFGEENWMSQENLGRIQNLLEE